ncbi:hypothetical protein F5876DRAFT_81204 [Lentinula aff. lateritia]|uniref:Uncharacterized protein n=1 Tax=Lentinula aff. lateritia TaxID=2804960 RepID=A0ACC1TMM3_9AGAR|nr:hypothetical protein F5876DRAFT_81204 [Lentinula aff. lateritia]
MTSNPRTYSDSCLIYLDPPNSGHAHAEIKTVMRNKIMIYANAPHGYYIGRDPQGNQYLFSFVNGEDAMKTFHDALMSAAKTHKNNMSSTSSAGIHIALEIPLYSTLSLEDNPPEWLDKRKRHILSQSGATVQSSGASDGVEWLSKQ